MDGDWLLPGDLERVGPPNNQEPRVEIPDAFKSRAMELIHENSPSSPSAFDLLMESKTRRHRQLNKEEKLYVRSMIYCKFVSHGYDSPEEMMAGEPEMVAAMNGDDRAMTPEKRRELENASQTKALKYAWTILQLQQQGITNKQAAFTFKKLNSLERKVVHELVACNNRTSVPGLPRLKSTTQRRTNYGTADIVLSVAN